MCHPTCLTLDASSPVYLSHHVARPKAAARISNELNAWYESQRLLLGKERLTKVNHLSPGMFGSRKVQVNKLKAAETTGVFKFMATEFLPKHSSALRDGRQLCVCARALMEYNELLEELPDVPGKQDCRELERLCLAHLVRLRPAGVKEKPKHHLFWHFTTRTWGDRIRHATLGVNIREARISELRKHACCPPRPCPLSASGCIRCAEP